MSGTTNRRELPLNVVSFNKPNMLTGLNQKVRGEERFLNTEPSWTPAAGEEEGSDRVYDSADVSRVGGVLERVLRLVWPQSERQSAGTCRVGRAGEGCVSRREVPGWRATPDSPV